MSEDIEVSVGTVTFRTPVELSQHDDDAHRAVIKYTDGQLEKLGFGQGGHIAGIYVERHPGSDNTFDFYRMVHAEAIDTESEGYAVNRTDFQATQSYRRADFSTDTALVENFVGELQQAMAAETGSQHRYSEHVTQESVDSDPSTPDLYKELFA